MGVGRLKQQATLDGVHLTARTLEHHLSNQLTLAAGYAELLAEDVELPERLRDLARQVVESAGAAMAEVRQMRKIESIDRIESGTADGPLIDLGPGSDL